MPSLQPGSFPCLHLYCRPNFSPQRNKPPTQHVPILIVMIKVLGDSPVKNTMVCSTSVFRFVVRLTLSLLEISSYGVIEFFDFCLFQSFFLHSIIHSSTIHLCHIELQSPIITISYWMIPTTIGLLKKSITSLWSISMRRLELSRSNVCEHYKSLAGLITP